MNTNWFINTVPGSLVIAAALAWPLSERDSQNLFQRIRFCLLSMLGFAFLFWGLRQQPGGFHYNLGHYYVDSSIVALTAMLFLLWLWFDKGIGFITDMLLGFFDSPDGSPMDSDCETRQIEKAFQLYRRGRRHRALRLCNRIIQSHSQYASTASTLAYWIENPSRLKFITPPRTPLRFTGRF